MLCWQRQEQGRTGTISKTSGSKMVKENFLPIKENMFGFCLFSVFVSVLPGLWPRCFPSHWNLIESNETWSTVGVSLAQLSPEKKCKICTSYLNGHISQYFFFKPVYLNVSLLICSQFAFFFLVLNFIKFTLQLTFHCCCCFSTSE